MPSPQWYVKLKDSDETGMNQSGLMGGAESVTRSSRHEMHKSAPVASGCKSSSLTATLLDVHALDKLQSWLELVVGDRLGPPEVSGYQ